MRTIFWILCVALFGYIIDTDPNEVESFLLILSLLLCIVQDINELYD